MEDCESGNHECDWLGNRPSNRLGKVPTAYQVSYVENFKLKEAGKSVIDSVFLQSRSAFHLS